MKRKKITAWALALVLATTPNMVMAAEAEENLYQASQEAETASIVADDTKADEDIAVEEIMQIEESEAVEEEWEGETEVDTSCEGDRDAEEDVCEEEETEEDWDGTYMGDDEVLFPTGCETEDACVEEMCGMEVPEVGEGETDIAAEDGEGAAENAAAEDGEGAAESAAAEPQTDNRDAGAEDDGPKTDYAESRDNEIAGVYQTVNGTQLCASAGTEDTSLLELDEDTEIYCYGYYTGVDGTRWYYVQCSQEGEVVTGFCSSESLKQG